MIPDPLPNGMWVIYLAGLLEIAGGLGLLLPDWRRRAGICLVERSEADTPHVVCQGVGFWALASDGAPE